MRKANDEFDPPTSFSVDRRILSRHRARRLLTDVVSIHSEHGPGRISQNMSVVGKSPSYHGVQEWPRRRHEFRGRARNGNGASYIDSGSPRSQTSADCSVTKISQNRHARPETSRPRPNIMLERGFIFLPIILQYPAFYGPSYRRVAFEPIRPRSGSICAVYMSVPFPEPAPADNQAWDINRSAIFSPNWIHKSPKSRLRNRRETISARSSSSSKPALELAHRSSQIKVTHPPRRYENDELTCHI